LLLCEISRKEFEIIYKKLNITINEVGESFYNAMIPSVIEKLQKLGFFIYFEKKKIIKKKKI
jgi:arginyl-tRNA synthetase